MKTDRPRVSLKIDLTKKDKVGNAPIFINVAWCGTRAKEACGKMTADDFTKKKYKNNKNIRDRLNQIEDRIDYLIKDRLPFTAKDCLMKHKKELTLYNILDDMSAVKKLRSLSYRAYLTAVNSFYSYFGEVPLDSLKLPQIQGYARSIGVCPSSVGNYLKKLHSLFQYAYRKGQLHQNCMDGWRYRADGYKDKDKPRSKSRADVTYIINTSEMTDDDKVREAALIWLAGYFFNGLALVDLVAVNWEKITEKFINGNHYYNFILKRQKTNEIATIMCPVIPLTKRLMNFLRTKPWTLHRSIDNYTKYINRHLHKIDDTLTYYQCRHTFAAQMVNNNVPLNSLASMMGRSVNGIATYVCKVTEIDMLSKAADALKKTEILPLPPEDIFLD